MPNRPQAWKRCGHVKRERSQQHGLIHDVRAPIIESLINGSCQIQNPKEVHAVKCTYTTPVHVFKSCAYERSKAFAFSARYTKNSALRHHCDTRNAARHLNINEKSWCRSSVSILSFIIPILAPHAGSPTDLKELLFFYSCTATA